MKVFLSWSGERSKVIAEFLKDWLKEVMQNLVPWVSSEDIRSGSRWMEAIAGELEKSNVGVICLTPENLKSEWIHFEAGAIAKLPNAYACTMLFQVKPADVRPPLAEFNHTFIQDRASVLKFLKELRTTSGAEISDSHLEKAFNKWWPDLEAALKPILEPPHNIERPRPEKEILEDVLSIVRGLASRPPFDVVELIRAFSTDRSSLRSPVNEVGSSGLGSSSSSSSGSGSGFGSGSGPKTWADRRPIDWGYVAALFKAAEALNDNPSEQNCAQYDQILEELRGVRDGAPPSETRVLGEMMARFFETDSN